MNPTRDASALIESHFRKSSTWVEMIKDLRRQTGTDLLSAQGMALAYSGWKARIIYAINRDVSCRQEALHHIRAHKDRSLMTLVNGRLYAAHDVDEIG